MITARDYNSFGNVLRKRILRAAAVDGCHVYIRMTSSGWRLVAVDPTLDKSGSRRQELTNRGYALVTGIGAKPIAAEAEREAPMHSAS